MTRGERILQVMIKKFSTQERQATKLINLCLQNYKIKVNSEKSENRIKKTKKRKIRNQKMKIKTKSLEIKMMIKKMLNKKKVKQMEKMEKVERALKHLKVIKKKKLKVIKRKKNKVMTLCQMSSKDQRCLRNHQSN